ncbi:C40 family peptidase [Arcanobacterium phocisimile]|uniref:C40 family peptidase n=1 Tax=Arcanobacterium phocisimile TaxID=1302235 RepID=A0ABX7IH03_9ACTO|nr:C40 family peptidase [Arcanobacterium phocisimile]QRV02411.1 C40 family peptidase [Arcanobacterium phocisimile]
MKKRAYTLGASLSALMLAFSAHTAFAAPVSDDDITQSQAAEETAKLSIADAELELARLSGKSTELEMQAAQARAASLKAEGDLADSIAQAMNTQKKANEAQENVDRARRELGAVSQAVYRDSAANITSSFYLFGADNLNEANKRTRAYDAVASQADSKVKHFAALEKIAHVLQNKADQAADEQREIANTASEAEEKAQNLAQRAQQQVELAKDRRSQLVTVLAHQRGTTEALEAQRLADIEADRAKRSQAAANALIASANADRFDQAVEIARKTSQEAESSIVTVKANLDAAEKSGNKEAADRARAALEQAEKAREAVLANQRAIEERAAAERAAAERAAAERAAAEARKAEEAERARAEAARIAAEEQAARDRAIAQQQAAAAAAAAQADAEAAAEPEPPSGGTSSGQALVDFGRRYLGTPYVWGGNTPAGWDCSGFMKFIFNHHGINVPRVSSEYMNAGFRQVSASEARPGDVLWWPGHVGMYSGNGMHIAAYNPAMGTQEGPVYGNPIYLRITG